MFCNKIFYFVSSDYAAPGRLSGGRYVIRLSTGPRPTQPVAGSSADLNTFTKYKRYKMIRNIYLAVFFTSHQIILKSRLDKLLVE